MATKQDKRLLTILALGVILFFGVPLIARSVFIDWVRMNGSSMAPELQSGDIVIMDKKGFSDYRPDRGDIVLFKLNMPVSQFERRARVNAYCGGSEWANEAVEKSYMSRIVAVEGDTLERRGNALWLNGENLATEGGEEKLPGGTAYKVTWGEGDDFSATVPEGRVFIVSDNRDGTLDSRCVGAIPLKDIEGEFDYILMRAKR